MSKDPSLDVGSKNNDEKKGWVKGEAHPLFC